MSCISEEVAQAEQMSARRRFELQTQLQDAKRDLEEVRKHRNEALAQADVSRALADEATTVQRRIAMNAHAVKLKLDAEADWRAIYELTQTIGSLERQLNAGPVVLTAEQCAAMDETAGVLA